MSSFIIHHQTELLKGDILKRYQAYQIGLANNFLQADEVRYKEDLKPLGFNFIRLGLQDVLLDPKTNTIYTPNTNQTTMFGQSVNQQMVDSMNDETEQRWEGQRRESNGQFGKGRKPHSAQSKRKKKSADKSSEILEKSDKNGIIKSKDIFIGRSVGAKAKNYDVMDLATGEKFHFVEGTRIQNAEVFAGKGSKIPYRRAYKYVEKYGGKESDWQHVKGNGIIDYYGEERKAEIHWSQCAGVGKYDFFIKRWLE